MAGLRRLTAVQPGCVVLRRAVQVPQGSTPRTLMVHLRGSLTRSLKAGDSVTLSGIFLPEPYTGARAMLRASLLTATYMEVGWAGGEGQPLAPTRQKR